MEEVLPIQTQIEAMREHDVTDGADDLFEDRQFPATENADLFHTDDVLFLLNPTDSIRGMNIDPIRVENEPDAIGRFPLMTLTALDDIVSQQTKIQTRFDERFNSMRQFVRKVKKGQ